MALEGLLKERRDSIPRIASKYGAHHPGLRPFGPWKWSQGSPSWTLAGCTTSWNSYQAGTQTS